MANSPNQTSRRLAKVDLFPYWAHPDVRYMASEWELLRDCELGEKQIKAKGQDYLPRMEAFTDDDYTAYLDRAVFYNMISRTKGGMVGSIFRRLPNIQNRPTKLDMSNVGQEGEDFRTFATSVAAEIIHMGRVGVLVDRSEISTREKPTLPYLTMYIAESILAWDTAMIDGRKQLTRVVLREIVEDVDPTTGYTRYLNQYRVLRLTQNEIGSWVYTQELYKPLRMTDVPETGATIGVAPGTKKTRGRRKVTINGDFNADSDGRSTGSSAGDANIFGDPDEVMTPTVNGVPFSSIPFVIFGPQSCNVDMEKSPLLDIARLNISHYRSYAHLEHGRFYVGLPVYWAMLGDNDMGGEWTIGPSVVWEIPIGGRAGILEFNGNGLKFLADALTEKESQVAALGGRLIGLAQHPSTGESDNQVQIKDRNEQALLLACTLSLDQGFTKLMHWFCKWIDVPEDQIAKFKVEFNKDFLFSPAAAREFRAIEAMYLDGVLPIEVVFDYFKRAEVIPDWLDIEEFKALLHSAASFPDQPDFQARVDGYTDASAKVISDDKEKDRELELELADKTGDNQLALADKTAKTDVTSQRMDQQHQIRLQRLQQSLMRTARPGPASANPGPSKQAQAVRNQSLQRREVKSTRPNPQKAK